LLHIARLIDRTARLNVARTEPAALQGAPTLMFEWPPNLTLFFALVFFLVASVAVRGWRDLAIFLLLSAALTVALKWIGGALGLTMLAADVFIVKDLPRGTAVDVETPPALVAALIVAALAMIAWKEIRARRAPGG
jgi:hypothetical protein